MPVHIVEATVGSIRIKLPDFSCWTLDVAVDGINFVLRQKTLPEVRVHLFNQHPLAASIACMALSCTDGSFQSARRTFSNHVWLVTIPMHF